MRITILSDDKCWFVPYGLKLQEILKKSNHNVNYVFNKNDIKDCDICFILSFSKLIPPELLKKNKHNIVVHASDLPKGKGFSPLQWQILEGKNTIKLTLFEAVADVDAGPYYVKSEIKFDGSELYNELRKKLGEKIIEMCNKFVKDNYNLKPKTQKGHESYYPKRTVKDDEIDPNRSIIQLFNHFRIADNDRYPIYFYYKNNKYFLKIEKERLNG